MSVNRVVLILVNHDVVIYNFRFELVERLIHDGYEVHISSPRGEHTGELVGVGAVFHEIKFDRHGTNPIDEIRLFKYYKNLMFDVKPKIVLTYTIKCNIYGGAAARACQIPFVANVTGLGMTVGYGGIKEKIILSLYRFGLKGAQRVFFQNVSNKEYMLNKHVISSPYTVLPGSGVNLKKHCLEPYPGEENGLVFSTIGRIMRDKGTDDLISAAKVIKKSHPEIVFRLIGFFDGDYKDKVKTAVEEGIIQYISQQKDVHEWISSSHAIIHPSHHEGMSNVLLEAAATGRPVLAGNIPGCRESFDDGVSGFGFNVCDVDDLIRTIERFIELPHEEKAKMGLAGRSKMERDFDRQYVVEKYLQEI